MPIFFIASKRIDCTSMLNEFFLYVLENLHTRDIGGGDRAAAPHHPAPSVLDNEGAAASELITPERGTTAPSSTTEPVQDLIVNRCMVFIAGYVVVCSRMDVKNSVREASEDT